MEVTIKSNDSATWRDVTVPVSKEAPVWPGDPSPVITAVASVEDGDDYHLTEVFMCVHTGTHIDAPLHFIAGGKDITQLNVFRLMGKARVIDAVNVGIITAEWLMPHAPTSGERLIFKTIPDSENRITFLERSDFPALDPTGASYLTDAGVVLVGIDGLSIAIHNELAETHRRLLEKEVVIIEHLNLNGIQPGNYEIIAMPMLIEGAEAAPARVFLRALSDSTWE